MRSLAFTFFIIIILQIRIGPMTLEERAFHWAQNSSVVKPIQMAAESGVHLIQQSWNRLTRRASQESSQRLQIKFERSRQYFQSKGQDLRESFSSSETWGSEGEED